MSDLAFKISTPSYLWFEAPQEIKYHKNKGYAHLREHCFITCATFPQPTCAGIYHLFTFLPQSFCQSGESFIDTQVEQLEVKKLLSVNNGPTLPSSSTFYLFLEGPQWGRTQLPSVTNNTSFVGFFSFPMKISFFLSLSILLLPGVTFQINYLQPSPYLKLCFWGNLNKDRHHIPFHSTILAPGREALWTKS